MPKLIVPVLGLSLALAAAACSSKPTTGLRSAASALDASGTHSIEYSGSGHWYQFGQAPAPGLPWPSFDVSRYVADIDYDTASGHVQIVRRQTIEPGRARPAPVEQRPDQYVSGSHAWNLTTPANNGSGTGASATLQAAAAEERAAEIWSSPHGFIKAAIANNASSKAVADGTEWSFTTQGKYRYSGVVNARGEVVSVRTWIDNPVLGDTLVETRYHDYADFNGVTFPKRIQRLQGGHPVLDIAVSEVRRNLDVGIVVPPEIASILPSPPTVTVSTLANGVYYLTGGSHHSVAIEQADHIVVVEAPQNEERSLAVIAAVKQAIPNKPIRYLVNTHAHFDHSGGLRSYVAEGATIVTHAHNQPYYESAWSAPRRLNPDRLAASRASARFDTFTERKLLSDGKRSIEIHPIAGNGHNDAFALVYLPAEKILIEADAYTPLAPGAAAPASANPYSVNLDDNLRRLKLEVSQIAALHGPGVVPLADLRRAISRVD